MDPSPLEEQLHAGLPFLDRTVWRPDYNPDRPIRIVRRWWEPVLWASPRHPDGRRLLLRLDLPPPPNLPPSFAGRAWRPPDLEVRWLGTVAGALYLVLEVEPLDLDDGVTQYVARLLPRRCRPPA
jgi:hypothetical protein